ncbi:MAG: SIMPL domain-containing protein [Steroidobacteraceae bacterium]
MRSAPLRVTHLLLAALLAPAAAQTPAPAAPLSSIRVTGDARIAARPDRVQIDIGVLTQAALSHDAATANARQLDAVLAAVRSVAGPTAQLRTVSYSLSPNYQYHPGGGEPTLTGYSALNVVEVTLDDLTRLGDVIDAATRTGANRVQGIQFTLRDQDAVRTAALREAAIRARGEADTLAGALNLKVLRVLTVEESSPRIVPIRAHMAAARAAAGAADVATPVESGTLDVTAEVALTVEVGPATR